MGNTNQVSPKGKRTATMLCYFLTFFGIVMAYGTFKFQHWFFLLLTGVSLYWAHRFYRIAK